MTCRSDLMVKGMGAAVVCACLLMLFAGCASLDPAGGGQAIGDWDEDGIPDHLDNCPWHNNPQQSDCDNDGSGDACDMDFIFDGW